MLLIAAIVAFFVYGLIASMLGTILHDLSKHFSLTPKENGWIAGAQAVGLIAASLVAGSLLDYAGMKAGFLIGLLLIALALFVLPHVRNIRLLLLLFFVLGAGGATVVTSASALASNIDAAHRASILNLTNLFFGVGGMLTPFLAANIFANNWKRLCYVVGALTSVTLLIELTAKMPEASGMQLTWAMVLGVMHDPLLWLAATFLFLYTACEVGVWNWLPRLLIARGISKSKALNILSFGFALGLLLGRATVSVVLLRVSATQIALFAAIGITLTTVWLLQTRSAFWGAASVFCAGVCMAPIFPTTVAIVGDHFHHLSGTAMGLAISGGWIGLAASSPIIGNIAGNQDDRLGKALYLIPVFGALMIAVAVAIRPYA